MSYLFVVVDRIVLAPALVLIIAEEVIHRYQDGEATVVVHPKTTG